VSEFIILKKAILRGYPYIGAAEDEEVQEKGDVAENLPAQPQSTQCSESNRYRLRNRSQDVVDCHFADRMAVSSLNYMSNVSWADFGFEICWESLCRT
jgi:hypothetical protein